MVVSLVPSNQNHPNCQPNLAMTGTCFRTCYLLILEFAKFCVILSMKICFSTFIDDKWLYEMLEFQN